MRDHIAIIITYDQQMWFINRKSFWCAEYSAEKVHAENADIQDEDY